MISEEQLVEQGIRREIAHRILSLIEGARGKPQQQQQVWRSISKTVLTPVHPFQLHQLLYEATYAGWDTNCQGPRPAWVPTLEGMRDTNLANFMREFPGNKAWATERTGNPAQDYTLLQRISWQDPETFWPPMLKHFRVQFERQPSRIFQPADNPDEAKWLPGARLNIAASALWGRDEDAPAILYAAESSPSHVREMSLKKLRVQSQAVAAALQRKGLKPGSAVAICMPMTTFAVIAYLGVILAGCSVVGIADSFAPSEIAARLRISDAVLLITQDIMLRDSKWHDLFGRVTGKTNVPAIVIPAEAERDVQVQLRNQDETWQEFVGIPELQESFQPHMADPNETTNILFSSGTTGDPKAIPWTHITPIRAATDAWAQNDVRRGDVVAFPTNLGWMMGPFLIFAALLNGAAIALFEGAPLGRPFCQFVAAARVNVLGTVPSIVRSWRRLDCIKGLDWGCVRTFSSTGEASSPEDSLWLMSQAGYKPILELCGGTELGGAFLSGSLLQAQAPSTFSIPTLGSQVVILAGKDSAVQTTHASGESVLGELALVPPFLGGSQRLLNADHFKVYYKGMPQAEGSSVPLRRHGDVFERLPGGYYCAHGRSDDTMNLGGIKVSSVEIERACVKDVEGVSEAAAVAVPEEGGGPDKLVIYLVPSQGGFKSNVQAVKRQCQASLRKHCNPLFKIHQVIEIHSLPRTATNKVLRRELRAQLLSKPKL